MTLQVVSVHTLIDLPIAISITLISYLCLFSINAFTCYDANYFHFELVFSYNRKFKMINDMH